MRPPARLSPTSCGLALAPQLLQPEPMRLSWLVLAPSIFGGLVTASPARAQETESRPLLLTVDPGFCAVANGHLTSNGERSPFVNYLGGTFQLDLHGPLAANVFVGLGGCLLASIGGTARLAGQWHDHVRVTAGLGPTYASGGTVLAEGDVALEIRSRPGFALVLGPKLGVALNKAGGSLSYCVDNCNPSLPAGTYIVLFRLGLGFNL
jgi:hypothetical protein